MKTSLKNHICLVLTRLALVILTPVAAFAQPSAPSIIGISGQTPTSFVVSWNPVSGADGFKMDVAFDSNFSSLFYSNINCGSGSATSYTVTGLSPATGYWVRMYAWGSGGASGYSGVRDAGTTSAAPPAPTSLAGSGLTNISFVANWSQSSGASAYYMDVSISVGFGSYVFGYQGLSVSGTSQVITNLSPNTTYYYRVRAANNYGLSSNSNTITVTTLMTAPIATGISNSQPNSFDVNWTNVGASSYRLDVADNIGFSPSLSSYSDLSVTGTSATVSSVSPNTIYYYRIRAVNGSGSSANSNVVTVPAVPIGTTAQAASSVSTSSFVANWDIGGGAASYNVEVALDAAFANQIANLTASGASASVTSLNANTTYYYHVRSVNIRGSSGYSNTISVITTPAAPIANPADQNTGVSFRANWSGSTTQYRLDVSTASDFSSFVTNFNNRLVTATSEIVTGLAAGTTYYYRVRSVNASGTSTNSNVISFMPTLFAPVASSSGSLTSVSFTANWGTVNGATGYYLDVSTSLGFGSYVFGYQGLPALGISQSITNLSPNTTFYYRVRATNGTTTSPNSNTITVSTLMTAPIATGISNSQQNSFDVNWSNVGASAYRLDVADNIGFSPSLSSYSDLSVTGTSATVSSVSPNTIYYYRVRAVNASGSSANSNVIAIPALPVGTTARAASSVSTSSFVANWDIGSGAASYNVEVALDAAFISPVATLTTSAASIGVTSLSANTTYYYHVRSVNIRGSSAYSNMISVITAPVAPTANPADQNSGVSFRANWSGSTTQYRLDVSTASDFSSFVTNFNNRLVTATSEIVTGLAAGTTYYYRVRSVNASGISTNSNIISFAPTLFAPVAASSGSLTSVSFTANWGTVNGATGYNLDVSTSVGFGSYVFGYQGLAVSGTSQSITNLSPNTTYYYRVRATNGISISPNSNTITVTTLMTAPIATGISNSQPNSFDVNWSNVGASSYRLDVADNIGFSPSLSGYSDLSVAGTSATISSVSPTTTYYYRVRAVNGSGSSDNSNVITVPVLPLPTALLGPTAISSTSFTANWNVGSNASFYILEVSRDAGFSPPIISSYPTGTSAVVTGLTGNTSYYFRVTPANVRGVAAHSASVNVTTVPAPPATVAASNITARSFQANWTGGLMRSRLDVSKFSDFSILLPAYNNRFITVNNEIVFGLEPSTEYYYRVRAENPSGQSGNSDITTVLTLCDAPVVSEPSAVTATSFVANWSPATGASSYQLDLSTHPTFDNLLPGFENLAVQGTSLTVSGSVITVLSQPYYYRVRAVNSSGISLNSKTAQVFPLVPTPVALESINKGASSFVARWEAVYSATAYLLDVSTDRQFSTFVAGYHDAETSQTSFSVTGLQDKNVYYYRVRARNGAGTSYYSNQIRGLSLDQNYLRTITLQAEVATKEGAEAASITHATNSYQFYDGLGRSLQTVVVKGSPQAKDVVQPVAYDELGRQAKTYLPYTIAGDGWYRPAALADPLSNGTGTQKYRSGEQFAFYQSGGEVASDTEPYAVLVSEKSPLNRVLKQGAPGTSWQPNNDASSISDNTVKKTYELNGQNDVLLFTYDAATGSVSLAAGYYYPPAALIANKTLDEHNNVTIEFIDKLGHLVCKQVQYDSVSGAPKYASTYYLYDDYSNLVVVLPPEAIGILEQGR